MKQSHQNVECMDLIERLAEENEIKEFVESVCDECLIEQGSILAEKLIEFRWALEFCHTGRRMEAMYRTLCLSIDLLLKEAETRELEAEFESKIDRSRRFVEFMDRRDLRALEAEGMLCGDHLRVLREETW